FWQLKFPSGAAANCGTSYYANVNRLYASAERGRFQLEPAYSYGGIRGLRNGEPMDYPQINQQAAQMDDFAECVIHDRPSRVSGEEGLRDMKIVEGIYKALETGGTVDL
ncbi:MAG: Gfo/Idh/MocA family oxidoreductase, partial [Opitutales bacterium]